MPNAEKRNEDNFESDKKEENKDSIDVPSKYIATPNTGWLIENKLLLNNFFKKMRTKLKGLLLSKRKNNRYPM